ncbi:hypothetical protein O1611_g2935 [Lasiodiplodia mahajangana]|uniref:Uncharacterized protein n=1 Tax=Lasiodiplodia mahajangana TaxID=1108764 RepID=A0ACC2JTU8_9PEZI|nr:hypothetical protein O1611_g2935 [Lasiodiplodia mahajangana]
MAEQTSPPPAAREKLDAQVKSADMTEDMQQEAIDVAQEAMGKFTIEKDIAQHIKKTFDERKGPTWHCIRRSTSSTFTSATVPSYSSRPSRPLTAAKCEQSSRLFWVPFLLQLASAICINIGIGAGNGNGNGWGKAGREKLGVQIDMSSNRDVNTREEWRD